MLKNNIRNLNNNIIGVLKRFPIPVLFIILFCIISVGKFAEHKFEGIYVIILLCGIFLFITLKLFAESHAWKPRRYYIVGAALFLVIAWGLYTASDISIPFLVTGLFLSIFIAPFINRRVSSTQIWVFNYLLWIHICFVLLVTVILFLGLSVIIASLNFLYGINLYGTIYANILLTIGMIFSSVLAMAGIPERFDATEVNYPKTIRFILSYIALPLLFIYAVILYAYTAKILINFNLPKGGVAYLVMAFGCAGIGGYLVSYPLHREQGIINLFSRYFFKILLIPLILLAIAISVRIQKYGVTEGRYAILLCLIWLASSASFALIKPGSRAAKFVFSSLVILLLFASFGPWGAVNISVLSQLHRLETLMEKNQVLINNQLHNPKQALSRSDIITISSIMDYIVNTKKTDLIKPWFANLPNTHINQEQEKYSAKIILQDMGISYIEPYYRKEDEYTADENKGSFSFNNNWWDKDYIFVSGYDYLVNISGYSIGQSGFIKNVTLDNSIKLSIRLEPASSHYIVHLVDFNESVVFELEDLIKNALYKQHLIMDKESSKLAIRLIINRIYGQFDKDTKKPIISSIATTLLIKRK
ncbi:MAG: hypothetical protein K0R73_372 [Candidatus Midichloriaceae bacterium]|jgi:hypothetical protein|nr:hypothetical protein [Candidatus Midichloriaceae bacterium]